MLFSDMIKIVYCIASNDHTLGGTYEEMLKYYNGNRELIRWMVENDYLHEYTCLADHLSSTYRCSSDTPIEYYLFKIKLKDEFKRTWNEQPPLSLILQEASDTIYKYMLRKYNWTGFDLFGNGQIAASAKVLDTFFDYHKQQVK
jgi:hypothetical protein